MTEDTIPAGAIQQRDKETYAIVPRIPVGLTKLEDLKAIVEVAEKYNIPAIKITSGHRLALVGMKADQVNDIWKDLNMDQGKATELCLHYVQACPGSTLCSFGKQDALGLGIKLEDAMTGMPTAAKIKVGVSGCGFCCGESFVRDIGLLAKNSGWTVIFGGNSGKKPRTGDIIAEDLNEEEVIDLAKRCLEYYAANAKTRERTARFIERIGIEAFKTAIK